MWRHVRGVLTDIDDTLTTDGAITPDALAALEALRAAGLPVIAITSHPADWSEPFARTWPLSAIVAENGAVALARQGGALRKWYFEPDAARRQANYARLQGSNGPVSASLAVKPLVSNCRNTAEEEGRNPASVVHP